MARVRDMRGGKDYDAEFGTRMRGTGTWARLLRDRFDMAVKRLGYSRERQPLDMSRFVPPAPLPRVRATAPPSDTTDDHRQGSLF